MLCLKQNYGKDGRFTPFLFIVSICLSVADNRRYSMFKKRLIKEWNEFRVLMRSVPSIVVVLFVLSVFSMNLLANKSINLSVPWLALDCGIIVSWFAFFTMDVLTKRFGPKAATEITVLAIVINLFFCLLLFIGSSVSGTWGESYVEGSEDVLNNALNKTFGGTWYVVLGSTAAFLASAIINNFSNFAIGKIFRKNPDGIAAFVLRTYVSTAIGQFTDNLIFALLVSHFFFDWTIVQCLTCAATGMLVELLCEFVFLYPGFAITKRWKKNSVGEEYLNLRREELKNENASDGNG